MSCDVLSAAVEIVGRRPRFPCEAVGTLHLGAGPLGAVELLIRGLISLSNCHCAIAPCAVRGRCVDCRYDRVSKPSGERSALLPSTAYIALQVDGASADRLTVSQSPAPLIRLASWSEVRGRCWPSRYLIAKWTSAEGPTSIVEGSLRFPVDGLSRCQFEFRRSAG